MCITAKCDRGCRLRVTFDRGSGLCRPATLPLRPESRRQVLIRNWSRWAIALNRRAIVRQAACLKSTLTSAKDLKRAAGWANRRHDGRMSSGGDVPCVDVLRAALTVHLTATGI